MPKQTEMLVRNLHAIGSRILYTPCMSEHVENCALIGKIHNTAWMLRHEAVPVPVIQRNQFDGINGAHYM